MALTCNLDPHGRRLRLIAGTFVVVIGVLALGTGLLLGSRGLVIAAIGPLLGGGFLIFEGRAGWCALRALGFKTKF